MHATDDSDRWKNEASDFQSDLLKSINKVIVDRNLDYIPGSVEWADFDPTATSNAVAQLDFAGVLPRGPLNGMLDTYLIGSQRKHRGEIPWNNYTAYEIRIIGAFVRLGKRYEANELLELFPGRPPAPRVEPVAGDHLARFTLPRAPRRCPPHLDRRGISSGARLDGGGRIRLHGIHGARRRHAVVVDFIRRRIFGFQSAHPLRRSRFQNLSSRTKRRSSGNRRVPHPSARRAHRRSTHPHGNGHHACHGFQRQAAGDPSIRRIHHNRSIAHVRDA